MSALTALVSHVDLYALALTIPLVVLLAHLLPYLHDPHGIRPYPGPSLAKFSHIWLGLVAKNGHLSEDVHKMHQKYGPFVRISPNHISIAHPDALSPIYTTNATNAANANARPRTAVPLKSGFYDAFVSIRRGLFNTRTPAEHARKRKIVAPIFAPRSIAAFEPHVRFHVGKLMERWDWLCEAAGKGQGGGSEGEGWRAGEGRVWLDCLPWANYLAFDIVGDLAFGEPFGMLDSAQDLAHIPADPSAFMRSPTDTHDTLSIPAIKILNGRGEYSLSTGVLPAQWRPFLRHLIPWYKRGSADVKTLAGIAIVAVARRLAAANPSERVDLLSRLLEGRDAQGENLGREEVTAEALTFLIAGSDTTSNSTCAIIYYLALNPHTQSKLQHELDTCLSSCPPSSPPTADQLRPTMLPYLNACINEALRLHSTSALGLPRVVPAGGLSVLGQSFKEGTVLSVPSYSVHRDKAVWGEDVEAFRPERWFEGDAGAGAGRRGFNPFSTGPRACVGKNLAILELQMTVASIMRRYDIVLENPGEPLETREGFLRKPLGCRVGIKRRDSEGA